MAAVHRFARPPGSTRIAEAQRDYQSNVAQCQAVVNEKKAEADLAYDLQRFKTGQLVKAEEVEVQIIEKQKQIESQKQEILRKQCELEATVQKPADAERHRVETEAAATRFQLETEAAGAKFFKLYNEAAVIQMVLQILPELAGKISEPLSKVEKMVVINSGNGDGAASKVTREITQIMSQLPPVLESPTGVKLEELLQRAATSTLGGRSPAPLANSSVALHEGM